MSDEAEAKSCPPCNARCHQGRTCSQTDKWHEEDRKAMRILWFTIGAVVVTVLVLVGMMA